MSYLLICGNDITDVQSDLTERMLVSGTLSICFYTPLFMPGDCLLTELYYRFASVFHTGFFYFMGQDFVLFCCFMEGFLLYDGWHMLMLSCTSKVY